MSTSSASIQTYQAVHLGPVTIYALVDPRDGDVRYIGKAVNPKKRMQQHLAPFQLSYYRSQKVSWIKSLFDAGVKPEMKVLEVVAPEDANEAEIRWIEKAKSMGARLTNGTAGGDGGAITDPDAKARVRAAHLGVKRSAETRSKMSESAKARCADEKERERLRSISNGKPPVFVGEKNPRTKLSDAQVREIRQKAAAGAVLYLLAAEYGITGASVTQIVTGQTRAAAGGPVRKPRSLYVLTDEQVEQVRQLYREGRPQAELAHQFGVSKTNISDLITGRRRSIRPGPGGT